MSALLSHIGALALALILVCALPGGAYAQRMGSFGELPYQISANSVSYEEERDLYEANGDVRIEQQGRLLTADWVLFSGKTQIGVAAGNVVIRDAGDVVQAEFAWVDLGSLRLLAERASVDSARPGFLISGDELEKIGNDNYRVERGIFTTCRCPPGSAPRPWDIRASETNITVGGYAVARNVTFRTLGVPILYTPLFVFPVKTERQSGFLQPSFSTTGRGGNELHVPFFWAARDNLNITLTPIYFEKRGIKSDVDIEYLFGEEGYGKGGFSFLNDDEIEPDDPRVPFSEDRYGFWLRHEQPLVPGTRFGVDLKRISDNQFVVDFENLSRRDRSARFLESTVYLTRARPGTYTGAEFTMLDDLQSPDDLDRDDAFLQRLPDLRFSWLPRELFTPESTTPLYASFDARYTYYYQRKDRRSLRGRSAVNRQFFDTGPDGVFDQDEPTADGTFNGADNHGDNVIRDAMGNVIGLGTGEGDGVFQEGELLADRGQRVDLYPRVSTARRFGMIETLSELGYRETLYFAEEAGSDTRGIFTGRIDARARFARTYKFGSLRLRHQVEPRIGLTLLSTNSQDSNPLFVPASSVRAERIIDGDPRALLRDPSDRIDDERFLNVALANRIYANPLSAGGFPRQVGELRIGGGYDFRQGRPTNVFLDGSLIPNPNLAFTAELGYDPKETRVEEGTVGVAFASTRNYALTPSAAPRRNSLGLSYVYVRDFEGLFENFLRNDEVFEDFDRNLSRINQAGISANYVLTRQIDLYTGGYVSFDDTDTRGGNLGVSFMSSCACWQLRAQVDKTTRPDDTRFTIEVRLSGIGR